MTKMEIVDSCVDAPHVVDVRGSTPTTPVDLLALRRRHGGAYAFHVRGDGYAVGRRGVVRSVSEARWGIGSRWVKIVLPRGGEEDGTIIGPCTCVACKPAFYE